MEQQRQYIAEQVRAGRLAKGLTQLDLSHRTNISLRSIQRIESAEVTPRAYTLNILSTTLGLQLQHQENIEGSFTDAKVEPHKRPKPVAQLLIAAVGGSCLTLLASAFLAQSPHFPETTFELFLFWAAVAGLYLVLLVRYLKK